CYRRTHSVTGGYIVRCVFPHTIFILCLQRDLLGIQRLLNSTEFNLHQLTALLDCRGLHKNYLDGLMGVCYDGVEGLLYLCLFSLLSVSAFCAMLCAIPRVWSLIASR
uniref:Protein tweety homolog n=1 Tax=Hucho hucho TaxID=62062 RepID=A0A4W5L1M6_9TELE